MNKDRSLFPIDPETLDAFEARFSPGRVAPGAYSDPNDVVLFVNAQNADFLVLRHIFAGAIVY